MIESLLYFGILVVSVLVPYFISLFLHELSHKIKFSKYKIKSKFSFNGFGPLCEPINQNEEKRFHELSYEAKREVIMQGTKIDLIISIMLVMFLLAAYFEKMVYNSLIINFIIIILAAVIILIISTILKNLFHAKGDLSVLIEELLKK